MQNAQTPILVVDDDEGLNRLVRKALDREGFVTLAAYSGAEALRKLEEKPEALLLLDFYLSDMTAGDVAENLRRDGKVVPFIVMTGHGDEKTAVDMMKLGARDYITKEADFVSLLPHVLRRAIDQLDKERRLESMERTLEQRERALQSVYQMTITLDRTLDDLCRESVESLARILDVPCASIHISSSPEDSYSLHLHGKTTSSTQKIKIAEPALTAYRQRAPIHRRGDLAREFPDCSVCSSGEFRSMVCIPIIKWSTSVSGALCVYDDREREFSNEDMHLIQIFERYVSHELEHQEMDRRLRQDEELRLLGHLTSGVAHEVRNPLNAIGAMVEALFNELDESLDFTEYKDLIQTQVDRLSRLMEDLLALSRPPSDLRNNHVDLVEIVKRSIELWKEQQPSNTLSVTLTTSPSGSPMIIRGDQTKLEQVLVNLLDNASQHSSPGSEIQVTLSITAQGSYRIHLVDRGKGIAPQRIQHVFEPFYTTRREGTGLGLSIVRRLVEMHRGWITIRNNENFPGCTVEIVLPAASDTPN